jgi:hypothetical protein
MVARLRCQFIDTAWSTEPKWADPGLRSIRLPSAWELVKRQGHRVSTGSGKTRRPRGHGLTHYLRSAWCRRAYS